MFVFVEHPNSEKKTVWFRIIICRLFSIIRLGVWLKMKFSKQMQHYLKMIIES